MRNLNLHSLEGNSLHEDISASQPETQALDSDQGSTIHERSPITELGSKLPYVDESDMELLTVVVTYVVVIKIPVKVTS